MNQWHHRKADDDNEYSGDNRHRPASDCSHDVLAGCHGHHNRYVDGTPEDNPALKMFFKLFDWDMVWLNENFKFSGEMDESGWKLQMRPIDEESKKKLSKIDLEGTANILETIALDLSGGKDIRIVLSNQEVPWHAEDRFLKAQFGAADVGN